MRHSATRVAVWVATFVAAARLLVAADLTSGADAAAGLLLERAEAILRQAEASQRANNPQAAAREYGEALRGYATLAEQHPQWLAAYVAARIDLCDTRIEELVSAELTKAEPEGEPPLPAPSAATPHTPVALPPTEELTELRELERDFPPLLETALPSALPDQTVPGPVAETAPATGGALTTAITPVTDTESIDRLRGWRGWLGGGRTTEKETPQPPPTGGVAPGGDAPDETPDAALAMDEEEWDADEPAPTGARRPPPDPALEQELRRTVVRMLRNGSTQQALAMLVDAQSLVDASPVLRSLRATAWCALGQYEAARDESKGLLLEEPGSARLHVLLGTAYLGLGDVDIARDQMQLAIELDPEVGEAHYNLARLLLMLPQPELRRARYHYDQSLQFGGLRDDDIERALR